LAIRKLTTQDFGKSILPPYNHNSVSDAHTMFEIAGISSFTGLRMVNRIFSHGSTIAPLLASPTRNFASVDYDSSTSVCEFGSNNNTSISPIWSATEVEKKPCRPVRSQLAQFRSGCRSDFYAGRDAVRHPSWNDAARAVPSVYLTNNPDRGWLPWPSFRMEAILP
jgi:hypothetical protein